MAQCFVEYSARDHHGLVVTTSAIELVSILNPQGNVLTHPEAHDFIRSEPGRLWFNSKPTGNVFKLTVRAPDGKKKSVDFGWYSCEMHVTLLWSEVTSPADSSAASVLGRVSGCNCAAGLWIRIVPMFGASNSSRWTEGIVSKRDCTFNFGATIRGERQMLIFGKDIDPFAVKAFNAQENGAHQLGVVDLGRECKVVGLSP